MYIREVKVSYGLRRLCSRRPHHRKVLHPSDAANLLVPILQHEVVEVAGILCLSTKLDVLAYHEVARGTLDQAPVHPRDVFRVALLANAASVILGHNHPSGDPQPSQDDVALTRRLRSAAEIVGVAVSDHVIVGADGSYFSFQQSGMWVNV